MLKIDIDASEFGLPLDELARRLADPAPVLNSIGMVLENNARKRAELGMDPDGTPWHPWAESTRKGYPFAGTVAAQGIEGIGSGRLLDRYGEMLRGLSHQVEGDTVRVGFKDDYATFHEWGTKHMPRRGLLMSDPDVGTLGEEDEAEVLQTVNEWLDEALGPR